jgi:excisionase family DNA binding protein
VAESTHIRAVPRHAFSVREACASLGVSRDWLYRQIRLGRIGTIKLGGRRFVPAGELERIARGCSRSDDCDAC